MKPSIPKGTRDFLPSQVRKRNFIFDIIKTVFKKYGYQPLETPAMELLSTLTGKYGEEGDRLLFKILNNGEFLSDVDVEALKSKDEKTVLPAISKRGLRYDLTVPFARFVVMHQNDITFPFKRFQIQPVWRADRPQKGRYHEFYQCDVDVVGSDSLMYEAELVNIFDEVFAKLDLKVIIKVNNRKVLYGLAETQGMTDKFMEMTMAIDKLDKIGPDKVIEEMVRRGIEASKAANILSLLEIDSLEVLASKFENAPEGLKGIEELRAFHQYLDVSQQVNKVQFDLSLARGLSYYTGCIFEVAADASVYQGLSMGSIGGGGRYDDLTSIFGMSDMSGVGVSFGAERIYDVMEEFALFPEDIERDIDVLVIAFDDDTHKYAFSVVGILRKHEITADIYPTPTKLKKQMKYADDRKAPYVLLIGSDEMASGNLTLKDMQTSEQVKLKIDDIINKLS